MPPIDSKHPAWMEDVPEPRQEERKFNDLPIVGWLGMASTEKLQPWVQNPRIGDPVENWIEENVGRQPSVDDLMEIMIDYSVSTPGSTGENDEEDSESPRTRRNALMDLAESIRLNGTRIPLVVTQDRRILDGNRRFFANLYLYRNTEDERERKNYQTVPVWVLPKGIEPGDEDCVLTELNAINDCYKPWPYAVTAKRIYEDKKKGMSDEQLQRKYHNYSKSRINQTVEAYRVAEQFLEHHGHSAEARDIVDGHLIWFDQLTRSNGKFMDKNDFLDGVFDLVLSDHAPFSSARDFIRLGQLYNNPEAWKILTTSGDREALKRATFVLDRERYEGKSDAPSKMKRVNDLLTSLVDGPGFGSVDPTVLKAFHDLAEKVPDPLLDTATRARRLMEMLDGLTSKEIALLPRNLVKKLGTVADRVKKQADSYKGD